MSHLKVANKILIASPNIIKIGRVYKDIINLPFVQLLREKSHIYNKALETVNKRTGKQIIHENLMLAKVKDLSLKVSIDRSLGSKIVSLPDDYIAFPNQLFGDIQKLVNKSGNVIKVVEAK